MFETDKRLDVLDEGRAAMVVGGRVTVEVRTWSASHPPLAIAAGSSVPSLPVPRTAVLLLSLLPVREAEESREEGTTKEGWNRRATWPARRFLGGRRPAGLLPSQAELHR